MIKIYQSRKDFIYCSESLVAYYLSEKGVPYHFLLSNTWNFIYRSPGEISAREAGRPGDWEDETTAVWDNLADLYGIQKIKDEGRDLREALREAAASGEGLFVCLNGRHLPWHDSYQQKDEFHYNLMDRYDVQNDQVLLINVWPKSSKEWVAVSTLEEAYYEKRRTYKLTEPKLNLSQDLVSKQLKLTLQNMRGQAGASDGGLGGVAGVSLFLEDIVRHEDYIFSKLDELWDSLKYVIDAKDGFLEFLHFLSDQNNGLTGKEMGREWLETFDQTVQSWEILRRLFLKSKFTGWRDVAQFQKRIAQILEQEWNCIHALERVV
ncbi:hypothetical protein ACFQZE_14385 [Paenibacillus sp. GCM10027627]|uniref:hypothetical protein n=1 Tax=unclassified Paenibacillus TaxID=185978 RepID=UPI003635F796